MIDLPCQTSQAPDSVAEICILLKAAGYRFNEGREIVARTLLEADTATTAEDIWMAAHRTSSRISRATVYRTLNIFSRLRITEPAVGPRGSQTFRLRRTLPSVYLVDADTGSIDEIDDPALAEALARLTRSRGYQLRGAVELRVEPCRPSTERVVEDLRPGRPPRMRSTVRSANS